MVLVITTQDSPDVAVRKLNSPDNLPIPYMMAYAKYLKDPRGYATLCTYLNETCTSVKKGFYYCDTEHIVDFIDCMEGSVWSDQEEVIVLQKH
jgi:hypothetical protein